MSKPSNNYGEILRSSSIVGGAQVIIYLIGLVRVKLAAVLLGPTGVGLLGLYQSITAVVGMAAGMGIDASGVREVAQAHGTDDPVRVAATVETVRRASWVSGVLGLVLMAALAWPLSQWLFEADDATGRLALLGLALLLAPIDAGEASILRGTRRIADLARRNILAALGSMIASVALYLWLGEQGIVPALIVSAGVALVVSRWYARRVGVERVGQPWRQTWAQSRRLVSLGLAFMWSGLLAAGVALAIRALIVRELGVAANGIYQAAWGISGMFAGFILGAMGSDFYPRLTAVAHDDRRVNELVNEQTEIGVLLALPGLLATLALSPWALTVFYSSDFASGSQLLAWFVVGAFGRVVSWPMGFILLARGASRWFAATETLFSVMHLVLVFLFVDAQGLKGVAVAFAVMYLLHTLGIGLLVRRLTGFTWSPTSMRLLAGSGFLGLVAFGLQAWAPRLEGAMVGVAIALLAAAFSVRGVTLRLGANHRYVQRLARLPGGRFFTASKSASSAGDREA